MILKLHTERIPTIDQVALAFVEADEPVKFHRLDRDGAYARARWSGDQGDGGGPPGFASRTVTACVDFATLATATAPRASTSSTWWTPTNGLGGHTLRASAIFLAVIQLYRGRNPPIMAVILAFWPILSDR